MTDTPFNALGIDSELYRPSSLHELQQFSLDMVRQGRHTLDLLTRDLDPPLFDRADFVDAVSALARQGTHSRVRILVRDSTAAVRQGHRLIPLLQKLSSRIAVHRLSSDHADFNQAFLVVDGTAYVDRPQADRYEATVCFNNRLHCERLLKTFQELWEPSEPDSQLRRLHL